MVSVKKILILVTEDWFFLSHRLSLGLHLLECGFDVAVACRVNDDGERIRKFGFKLFDIPFARECVGPIPVLRASVCLRKVIYKYNPSIVVNVALRSIVLGWMASIGYAKLPIVNLMVGRGSLFTAAGYSIRMAITKKILERMIRLIFYRKNSYNVFLNDDDISLFIEKKWSRYENSFMIPGPGININSWKPVSEPKKDIPIILFVGRLLRDKGIIELVEASRFLHKKNIFHRLMIVGRVDSCNPNAISLQTIEHWVTDYAVEWLGQRDDVLDVMSNANIIAMPSYLEGFGRVLLEAGLATRAVVTCDTVGCRQAVRHMDNGLLVEPRNIGQIADALEKLILDPKLRDQLAERNYERVKNEFSDEVILPKYSELFKHILSL